MKDEDKKQGIEQLFKAGTIVEIWREFAPLLLICVVLVVSLFFIYTYGGYQRSSSLTLQEESEHLQTMKFSMVRDLEILVSDLRILLNSETLLKYISSPSYSTESKLQERLRVFSNDRRIYDQIRFIDKNGKEKVRINLGPKHAYAVSKNELQNKKERYYFSRTIGLESGQIFFSPLDLNVEMGEVQVPHNPMLRIGAPVTRADGTAAGIIILNYRAKLMLDRFAATQTAYGPTSFYLLNQDGYILKAANPEIEWGFVLEHEYNFAEIHPKPWGMMQKTDIGNVESDRYLHIFAAVYPAAELKVDAAYMGSDQDQEKWFLVAEIPLSELSYIYYLLDHGTLIAAVFLCFLFLLFGCWQIAMSRVSRKKSSSTVKLLSSGLEQSPAAVLITDSEGSIIFVNPKFEKMSGYTKKEILGENPRIFKSGKTDADVYENLWRTIKDGQTWAGDFENIDQEGRSYYVSAQISPIFGKNKKVEHFIAIQEDVTEKVNLQRKLEKIATTDSLTGALNRGRFMEVCEQELKRQDRYGTSLALLIFDLDYFKNINDTYGHLCGDKVLVEFVEEIKKRLRNSDSFGRLGGEEFAALLVETDREGAVKLAERLRDSIEHLQVTFEQHQIRLTVSIGCTTRQNTDTDLVQVLKRADSALYLAKERGRNRVEYLSRISHGHFVDLAPFSR